MRRIDTIPVLYFFVAIWSIGCSDATRTAESAHDTETGTITSATQDDTGAQNIPSNPSIPRNCTEAEQLARDGHASAVGCEFYTVPLDNGPRRPDFDVVLSNTSNENDAHYEVYGRIWHSVSSEIILTTSGTIAPLEQVTLQLDGRNLYDEPSCAIPQAMMHKGAYKIIADQPLIAYQFHPISSGWSNDASILLPVSSWSESYSVFGYRSVDALQAGFYPTINHNMPFTMPYVGVIAQKDGTEVAIDPSIPLYPAHTGVCGSEPDITAEIEPFTVSMNAADVLFLHTDEIGDSLNGTTLRSNPDHPIAVFTGHQCARIPEWADACDRLEEQIPGIEYWGTQFVASRMPNRNQAHYSDPVLWQIAASEADTTVRFQAHQDVQGLPQADVTLQKGEVVEYYVYGSSAAPGDFLIEASKPIAVLEYMTSFETTRDANGEVLTLGDPSVAYVPPIDQFLSRYMVQIPEEWPDNQLVIARRAGARILIDNVEVEEKYFQSVAGSTWEAGRIPIEHGSHIVESEDPNQPFGLIVVGIAEMSSYAFTGGMGFTPINAPQ